MDKTLNDTRSYKLDIFIDCRVQEGSEIEQFILGGTPESREP